MNENTPPRWAGYPPSKHRCDVAVDWPLQYALFEGANGLERLNVQQPITYGFRHPSMRAAFRDRRQDRSMARVYRPYKCKCRCRRPCRLALSQRASQLFFAATLPRSAIRFPSPRMDAKISFSSGIVVRSHSEIGPIANPAFVALLSIICGATPSSQQVHRFAGIGRHDAAGEESEARR